MPDAIQSRPSDPVRDFCQWPYDPPATPAPNALRQSAILFHALALMPNGPALLAIVLRIRAFWGRFNTVWGLKSADGHLGLELYFYDYDRAERLAKQLEFFGLSAQALDSVSAFRSSMVERLPAALADEKAVTTEGLVGDAQS